MSNVKAMHRRGLAGQTLVLPDGRLCLVTPACRVEIGQIVKTADHEGKVLAVDSPVGGGHTHFRIAGYGFEGTETVRSAEFVVVITGGEAA